MIHTASASDCVRMMAEGNNGGRDPAAGFNSRGKAIVVVVVVAR